ncbi:Stomatin-1 [Blattella germanica]|nr:Stomatin-1 [Blattella germanica]
MQSALDEATDPWGVKVERVEMKDVRLPLQLQRAMAAEAEAAREARAKLRYLQTLNTISAEKNSTIIFPLPLDIVFYKKCFTRCVSVSILYVPSPFLSCVASIPATS